METQEPRIVRGRVELIIPHREKEIKVAYPFSGANPYSNGKARSWTQDFSGASTDPSVKSQILKQHQLIATGDQTASVIYAAYCSNLKNEPEFREIRNIMEEGASDTVGFWVFNKTLWTKKGVYVVQQDPEAIGIKQDLDQNELEVMLENSKEIRGVRFSKDEKVRFAPKETYNLEFNTPDFLAKNGFVIASYGEEGAQKLAEVSTKFKNQPYIVALEDRRLIYTLEQEVSTIHARFSSNSLIIRAGYSGLERGHGFGIWK
ncbi:MAG: hypothetical protein AABW63_01435 [Nanoarchaeota archaeon]